MSKRPYRFKVYESGRGWVWELLAPNGRLLCESAQGYATRQHAIRSARDVMNAIQTADITCP